jgi:hypothetical protein
LLDYDAASSFCLRGYEFLAETGALMTAHHSRSSSPFSGYLQGLRSRPQAWRTIAAVVGGLLVMLVVL